MLGIAARFIAADCFHQRHLCEPDLGLVAAQPPAFPWGPASLTIGVGLRAGRQGVRRAEDCWGRGSVENECETEETPLEIWNGASWFAHFGGTSPSRILSEYSLPRIVSFPRPRTKQNIMESLHSNWLSTKHDLNFFWRGASMGSGYWLGGPKRSVSKRLNPST